MKGQSSERTHAYSCLSACRNSARTTADPDTLPPYPSTPDAHGSAESDLQGGSYFRCFILCGAKPACERLCRKRHHSPFPLFFLTRL